MSWQKGSMNLVNSYQSWSQSFTFLTLSLANSFTFFKARSLGYSVNCFHSFYNCLKVVTRFHQLYLFNPVSLHSTVVIQSLSCVWLLVTPMDCSIPGFPVLHHFPVFAQTHVHWVSDAVQSSHPLSSHSPSAFNHSPASGSFQISQFFASGGQSIGVSASTSVLLMNIQDWFPLG